MPLKTMKDVARRALRRISGMLWFAIDEEPSTQRHVVPDGTPPRRGPPTALSDLTWDSATSASIVIDARRVPVLRFELPEVVNGNIGEAYARMLLSDYVAHMLPHVPSDGARRSFTVAITVKHPFVLGKYQALLNNCEIVGTGGPTFDGSEKALVKTLRISVARMFERGADNIWKPVMPMPRREEPETSMAAN